MCDLNQCFRKPITMFKPSRFGSKKMWCLFLDQGGEAAGCHIANLCQLGTMSTAWGEAKNGLVSADTYGLLDRRCYRSRCAQRHPGTAGGKPRSAVYAEHGHRRRGPWEPRHNRAQIGFTKYKLAEHSRRSTNKQCKQFCPGRHHASAESVD